MDDGEGQVNEALENVSQRLRIDLPRALYTSRKSSGLPYLTFHTPLWGKKAGENASPKLICLPARPLSIPWSQAHVVARTMHQGLEVVHPWRNGTNISKEMVYFFVQIPNVLKMHFRKESSHSTLGWYPNPCIKVWKCCIPGVDVLDYYIPAAEVVLRWFP